VNSDGGGNQIASVRKIHKNRVPVHVELLLNASLPEGTFWKSANIDQKADNMRRFLWISSASALLAQTSVQILYTQGNQTDTEDCICKTVSV
jgi:hypothetical protein